MSDTQEMERQLDELTDIAHGLEGKLEQARVTVQAIAADLDVDPASDDASETAAASQKRLHAVTQRLTALAQEMERRVDQT